MIRTTITTEFPPAEPVTLVAWAIAVRYKHSGSVEATALVCPSAFYAAVRWPEAARLVRQHAHRSAWRLALAELIETPVGAVLSEGSPTLSLLISDSTTGTELAVTAAHQVNARPHEMASALDRLLEPRP